MVIQMKVLGQFDEPHWGPPDAIFFMGSMLIKLIQCASAIPFADKGKPAPNDGAIFHRTAFAMKFAEKLSQKMGNRLFSTKN